MILGILSVVTFNLTDLYFVGQLGTEELAAIGFTFPVVMAVASLALGLGAGTASAVSRAIGAASHRQVQRLVTHSLILALLCVGILIGIGLATIDPLFTALGADARTLPLVRDYMEIWYVGMIFLVVPMVGNHAIRATGDTKFPSLVMVGAAAVNIALDPLLIFGWGPFPRLELQGAALATVIARSLTLIASLALLHYRERLLDLRRCGLADLWTSWSRILRIGIPAAGTNMINPLTIGIITALMARFGTEAVAGFGAATRIEAFSLMVVMALSASIVPFVGQNWGARQYERVYRALKLSVLFSIAWGLGIAAVLAIGARFVTGLFSDNPDVVQVASLYLYLVPISFGGVGIVLVSAAFFNALGRPLPGLLLAATRLLVLYVPFAILAGQYFGVTGVFVAASAANLAVGGAAFFWDRRTCRQAAAARYDLQSQSA